jgi:hypothetical protein
MPGARVSILMPISMPSIWPGFGTASAAFQLKLFDKMVWFWRRVDRFIP